MKSTKFSKEHNPIEVQREEKKQNNKKATLVIWSSPSEIVVDRSVALSSEPTPKSPELTLTTLDLTPSMPKSEEG